jgi:hypothetical protein
MYFLTESFFLPQTTFVFRRTPFENRWNRGTKISKERIASVEASSVRKVDYNEDGSSTFIHNAVFFIPIYMVQAEI